MGDSAAIGADGTIYFGSYDDNLYAVNSDGTQKWAFATGGGIAGSPAIGADGTIYVGSDFNLYAVNPRRHAEVEVRHRPSHDLLAGDRRRWYDLHRRR